MKTLLYILCLVIFVVGYIRYLERKTIFYPDPHLSATPEDVGLAYEDVIFKSANGKKLHGWFMPSPNAKATILYLHGNAGNISGRAEKMKLLHDLGVNVFIFDYQGYGKSEGHPSEEVLYEDAMAAYDYLMTRNDIAKDKIVGFGSSLGGAFAIDLATRRNLAGLIVDSSFLNAAQMASRIFPFVPSFIIKSKMDSGIKIQKVFVPKLFFHSQEDEVVPFSFGRALFDEASEPKLFVELKGSHNEGHVLNQDKYMGSIKNFLSGL